MGDNIKKPDHYCEGREYEPKDVIRDWGLNFNLGSCVKYISRAGRKGDKVEDLQKAKQFLQFEIEAEEEERSKNDVPEDLKSRVFCETEITAADNCTSDVLNGKMKFEDVPEDLKPRVISNIAQEVLDEQIIPPDEVRAAVIDRIVERINNGELDCFDIHYNLYNAYQDIRDAIARQAFRKVGEEQKSDIGMSCKEAAAIGDAIAKGFEEGFKSVEDTFTLSFKEETEQEEALSLADIISMIMKHNDIPEPDVIKLHFKFEDDPTAIPANTVSIKFHTNRKED